MQITEHESLAALQRLAKKEHDGRVRIRLQGIVLGRQGQTSRAVGEALGVSSRSVRDWVKRYNGGGAVALQEQGGRGCSLRLKAQDQDRFRSRIEAGAQSGNDGDGGDGACSLRGSDIQRILEEEFDTVYSLNGVYGLLHRLGYSSLMPRPRHAKADLERQETFKKSG